MMHEPQAPTGPIRRRCDVVVPTRNRPEALRRCLAALRSQTAAGVGVIVVDDASEPPVAGWLTSEDTAGLNLRVVRHPSPLGPAAARNSGVEASRADFIAFIDDDIAAAPDLLERHFEALHQSPTGAARTASVGPFVEPPDWKPSPWTLWEARQARFEAQSLMSGRYRVTWRQFHTGNNVLSRELFLEAGGFNTDFRRAEDDEFGYRLEQLGVAFVFQPKAIAWHYPQRTLKAWLAIPAAYAHYDLRLDALHPQSRHAATKRSELKRRNLLLKWNRRLFVHRAVRPAATLAIVAAARALYGLRLRSLSVMALSAAYDVQYAGALDDELAGRRAGPPDLALPSSTRV